MSDAVTAPVVEAIPADSGITTIIRQQPLPGEAARYEAWLKEIIPAAGSFAGHQAVNVIRPHTADGAYTIIVHFDTTANLRTWLDSDTRTRLVEKISPWLQAPEAVQIETGVEFWFTPPPAARPARPYKQFLVTLSAIFPLTMAVPPLFQPVFARIPWLGLFGVRALIVDTAIVALMVYVIMPRYTRAIARWLFG